MAIAETPKKKIAPIRPTGIKELDDALLGGLPSDATVLLAGNSGTGKTVLATQWLFNGYREHNEPGLYISLTEPVAKALKNAKKMEFFNKEYINPLQIYFTDLRGILQGLDLEKKEFTREDIQVTVDAIRNMAEQSGAKRIVLDSVTAMAYRLRDKGLIREFIFSLGTLLSQLDANVLLTSEVVDGGYSVFGVEEFISDGIIKLEVEREDNKEPVRKLSIIKMRGTSYLGYPLSYRITGAGIVLFPHFTRSLSHSIVEERVTTGIGGLEQMTGGGYLKGSTILLTGASGTGKSLIAMQYIVDGISRGEKCMYVSFEESHDQLVRNAKSFGWDLVSYEREGLLTIINAYPEQRYLEEHFTAIHEAAEQLQPKRIVIDSLSSLGNVYQEGAVYDFAGRLSSYMKEKNITTIYTLASETLMGAGSISNAGLSIISDHIIMLRYIEIKSELKHGLLILKMRGTKHDKKLREISFSSNGLAVLTEFKGYENILSGSARKIGETVEEGLKALFLEFLGPLGEQVFEEERSKGITPETVRTLAKKLGDQGVISVRRKEEFVQKVENIIGGEVEPKGEVKEEKLNLDAFLNISSKPKEEKTKKKGKK